MEIVFGILLLVVIIGLYLWSYDANEKCETPEGAELPECQSCNARNCSSRKE